MNEWSPSVKCILGPTFFSRHSSYKCVQKWNYGCCFLWL